MPREEIVGWRKELGGRGVCEVGDRAIDTDHRGSIIGEEEACEGSYGIDQLYVLRG